MSSNKIRFGNEYKSLLMSQNWGGSELFVYKDSELVDVLKAKTSVKLQIDLYKQGMTVFNYDLTGSTKAINKVANKCK